MKIIQTPNGIQLVDDSVSEIDVEVKTTSMEFTYERSEIPKELIDECNKIAEETGETQFIFDNDVSKKIMNHQNKDDQRNTKIDLFLSDSAYHIGDETEFAQLPSRFAYYDSEIRLTDRYKRYDYVVNFLKNLTFEPGLSNFGPEYEQSFVLSLNENDHWYKFIIRVSPNLFISIISDSSESKKVGGYTGYFNKSKIYDSIQSRCPNSFKEIIRERKLEDILNKKEV